MKFVFKRTEVFVQEQELHEEIKKVKFPSTFKSHLIMKTLCCILSTWNIDTFIVILLFCFIIKGKTVRSEDFDISLMIYFLQTLANIKVSDLYPIPTDTSTSAMLSRIKYIRNETTQNLYGKLTEEQFNQYWDDIGQVRYYIILL